MREYALRLGIDLGSSLSQSEIAALCDAGTKTSLPRGCVLARQDEPATCLHYLTAGSVKTYQTHASGRETVLRLHLPGSIIGLSSLTSRGHWDASSVALEPSKAVCIPKARFIALLRDDPSLSLELVRLLVDRLSDLHFRLGDLQAQTVHHRLAYVLLSLSRADPSDLDAARQTEISLTHEELSQMINSRRQTVTSVIREFADAGWIGRANRRIKVLRPEGLKRFLKEEA